MSLRIKDVYFIESFLFKRMSSRFVVFYVMATVPKYRMHYRCNVQLKIEYTCLQLILRNKQSSFQTIQLNVNKMFF